MTTEERLVADFGGTGLTMGPHLMAYHRADMNRADLRTEITSRYSTLLTHYAKCLKCQGA